MTVSRPTGRNRKRVAAHQRLSRGVPRFDPAEQTRMQFFVTENRCRCFVCKATSTHWWAVGRRKSGAAWAICVACKKGPR